MTLDRRALQVLYNHCAAAADAMAFTLMRTAHSTFVKETEDFSCTILDADGHAVASPRSFGAPWYSGIDYGPVLRMIDAYEEGDICIINDPYSGHVATHTEDTHIWKPIFHEGDILCFAGAVDEAAKRALRDGRRRDAWAFDIGDARRAFEETWTAERYAALTDVLAALPVG